MHITDIKSNRIVAMLLCILLLSNFILNIGCVYATGELNLIEAGYFTYGSEFPGTYTLKNGKMTVNFDKNGNYEKQSYVKFIPKETAIYSITVTGIPQNKNSIQNIKYLLFNGDENRTDIVRLAARYDNIGYSIITNNEDKNSTTIDVLLMKDNIYTLKLIESLSTGSGMNISVQKRNIGIGAMATTNIPSSAVSANAIGYDVIYGNEYEYHDYNYKFGMQQYFEYLLEDAPPGYKTVEYSDEQKKAYYSSGASEINQEKEDKGGSALEGILVDIVMAIGTVFMRLVELMIGSDVSLTIDNIVFNRMDQVIVDLTPLGGLKLSAEDPTIGKGVFNNPVVGDIIAQLYNALKSLAIVIYIVMLLYIGVKILLSVGTKEQGKSLKFLEYWITGLIILVVLPYFLPAIPVVSNAIVGLMESEAESMNSTYTVEEIIEKLGGDASGLGEDAEVEAYDRALKKEIERLEELIEGTPETREEAQSNIDSKIQEALSSFNNMSSGDKQILEEKIDAVIEMIDTHYDNWSAVDDSEYESKINEISAFIYARTSTNEIVDQIMETLPSSVAPGQPTYIQIQRILAQILANPGNPQMDFWLNSELWTLKDIMSRAGIVEYYDECADIIKDDLIEYTNLDAFTNLEEVFENYKNSVIYEEVQVLKDMRDGLNKDIMFRLKRKAQVENRFIYAVAWIILFYQTFAVLFMYYKRIFAIIILIIIFPVIMAFYVFDKLSDGNSQSLTTWIKEFLATMLIQILHASVYIILINIGIDACATDPSKNWFFLILTVCFLFPGERMIRSIIGLGGSSTLGELKNNFAGLAMGAYAVAKTYKGAKSFKEDGGFKGRAEKKKVEKEKEKKKKQTAEKNKKKKKSDLEKSKQRNREYRNMLKDERKERIKNNTATKMDKFKEGMDNTKIKINGYKAVQKAKALGGKVINGVTTVGKSGLKGAKFVGKVGSVGFKYSKKAFNVGKKAVGLTMGALEGMENFSQGGAASALGTAYGVAKSYGTFGDPKKKKQSQSQKQKSGTQSTAPVKYKSKYKNGEKMSNNRSTGSSNSNRGGSGRSNNRGNAGNSNQYNTFDRINTNYNYEEPEIRDNTSGNHTANNNGGFNGSGNNHTNNGNNNNN